MTSANYSDITGRVIGHWSGGGGSGSQPTDEVVQFTQIPGGEPSFPILAVDQVGGTFTVAGDQRAHFPLNISDFFVTGSTGNDSSYIPAIVTYDSGAHTTTVGPGTPLPDGTADGDVIAPLVYTAEVVIPPNGAVEWIEVVTDVAWLALDGSPAYWRIGDGDDPIAYAGGDFGGIGSSVISAVGTWQWPINTLHTAAAATPLLPGGTLAGYKLYPDGGTITIVASADPGVLAGSTRIVVHHHFTEPVAAPTRLPAA